MQKEELIAQLREIFSSHFPLVSEAMNYVEVKSRSTPVPGFIEIRDVVSHLFDLLKDVDDQENITKNIVEIKQHLRRATIETYQMLYDAKMAYLYGSYWKYRLKISQFEKVLFLRTKNQYKHDEIVSAMKEAQKLWVEARTQKNNDIDTSEFREAIEKFKNAYERLTTIDDYVDELWNDFNKRSYSLAGILCVVVVFIAFFL